MRTYMTTGETREVNGMRQHLYCGSLQVTDIRDAGRRGQTCAQFCVQSASAAVHSSEFIEVVERIVDAPTYAAALDLARASGLSVWERTHRAVDVLPAKDQPLKVVFRANGIQVGGALVKGHFSHGAAWTVPGTGKVIPEQVTFYARSLRSDLLRRVFAGEVQNGTDLTTDYFEEDRIRFGVDHPRYAEALAAAKADLERTARRQAQRAARIAARAVGF
jgi:hypothetical protein